MTQELATIEEGGRQLARPADMFNIDLVTERVAQIHKIMKTVMKEGVHFGPPNGKKNDDLAEDKKLKPTLLQPGAEILLVSFRLAADFPKEDVRCTRTEFGITYEVRCVITDQMSGAFLGSEWGTCSSLEEKYAWRQTHIPEEYDATPVTQRRLKWKEGWNGKPNYTLQQVRVNPDDVANTILAMACKRAKTRAARAALGASDIFDVNTEDLPEELQREYFGEEGTPKRQPSEALNKRQNPGAPPPTPKRFDVVEMLAELGFTEPGDEGKQKPSREGFSFLNKLGVPKSWKTWTDEDKAAVFTALHNAIEDRKGPAAESEPPADYNTPPDITDPFENQ